jgi:hypothetical protein
VPAAAYVRLAFGGSEPLIRVVPSPKSQAYLRILPSGSEDAEASKRHVSPLHVKVNDATGGALAPIVRVWLWVASL